MLRRKMLLRLGALVGAITLALVASLWLLQDVLGDLDHVNNEALRLVDLTNQMQTALGRAEVELYRLRLDQTHHLDEMIANTELVRQALAGMTNHHAIDLPDGPIEPLRRARAMMPQFLHHVEALATTEDPELSAQNNREALRMSIALRGDFLELNRIARDHAQIEQSALLTRFRWTLFGLTIGFLLMVNLSVMALLRMASSVVGPVERLVAAARRFGQERFDEPVVLRGNDEFSELAQALNQMAGELHASDQRRMEVIAQVAATVNHEINNATSIVEMQLELLRRQAGGDAAFEQRMRQIHQTLERISQTVAALGRVRRIVLTEYSAGRKMLDLARSVEEDSLSSSAPSSPADSSPAAPNSSRTG